MTFKAILGYDIVSGVSQEQYEEWLFTVHVPDLLANPHLDRIVLNKVVGTVTHASGGAAPVPAGLTFYRVVRTALRGRAGLHAVSPLATGSRRSAP